MGTCSFQIRNETFFCKVKSKIPDFEREKSRDCAETYIWYVAQTRPACPDLAGPRLSEQARDPPAKVLYGGQVAGRESR
jgi:hypothetical protein